MFALNSASRGRTLTYHYGVRVADEEHQKQKGYSARDNEAWTQAFMENLR